jgi:hypothetical protein
VSGKLDGNIIVLDLFLGTHLGVVICHFPFISSSSTLSFFWSLPAPPTCATKSLRSITSTLFASNLQESQPTSAHILFGLRAATALIRVSLYCCSGSGVGTPRTCALLCWCWIERLAVSFILKTLLSWFANPSGLSSVLIDTQPTIQRL